MYHFLTSSCSSFQNESPSLFIAILILSMVVGFYLLTKGGDLLSDHSSNIAQAIGIPSVVVGLTIVSIATSAPELFTSIAAINSGAKGLILGNIIGSNIANIGLILGLSLLISPIDTRNAVPFSQVVLLLILSLFFVGYLYFHPTHSLSLHPGALLLIFIFAYLFFLTISALKNRTQKNNKDTAEETKESTSPIFLSCIMIFVATAENKTNSAGTGIATGTTKANAGVPFLLTSQKDLGDLFGDPSFYSDTSGNMIHGSELNEYGLQTAYSLLGVTNQVFVVRADFDLAKLTPSANAPGGTPVDGAYWLDTQNTSYGLLEWNAAAVTAGGQSFTAINPIVVNKASELDGTMPAASVGVIGDYAVVTANNMNRMFYKNTSGAWVQVGSEDWKASWPTVVSTEAGVTW